MVNREILPGLSHFYSSRGRGFCRGKAADHNRVTIESLEGRLLLSSYALSNGTLTYGSQTVATNVISFEVGRSGYAYFEQWGNLLSINELPTGGGTTAIATVYSYGLRSDGDCYYWSTADNHLYINYSGGNALVDQNPIKAFGVRSDGAGYFWDGATNELFLNTVTGFQTIDANPIQGFGMRSDGSGYYWEVGGDFYINTQYQAQVALNNGNPISGFGMSSAGSAYYWDSVSNMLYLTNTLGTYQISSGTIQAFAADAAGNAYYIPTGTTQVWCSSYGGNGYTSGLKESDVIDSTFGLELRAASAPGYGGTVVFDTYNGTDTNLVFEPIYGIESTSGSTSGTELTGNVPVYLIYWGSAWNNLLNSPSMLGVTTSISAILGSGYFGGLTQYGASNTAHIAGSAQYTTSDPANNFSGTALINVLVTTILNQNWPQAGQHGSDSGAVYLVITPPGITEANYGTQSFHNSYNPNNGYFDYAWIYNSGQIGAVTLNVSQQLSDTMTDPYPNGAPNWTTESGGLWSTGGPFSGFMGDFEAQFDQTVLNGQVVQAYWSVNDQAFIIGILD